MESFLQIDLVGTVAQVKRELSLGPTGAAVAVEDVLGNDAVIAAQLLAASGARCRLAVIGPTEADVLVLRRSLSGVTCVPMGIQEGSATLTTCLEDAQGQRVWTFSRTPSLSDSIPPLLGDRVYIDLYEEFDDSWPALPVSHAAFVLGNLSQRSIDSLPTSLPTRMDLVQVSSPEKDVRYASALSLEASRRYRCPAVCTLGRVGAVLSDPGGGDQPRFHPAMPVGAFDPLGVGAMFSAGILLADAGTIDSMLVYAMNFVQDHLRGDSIATVLGS